MMNKTNDKKSNQKKKLQYKNVLEGLKDIGSQTGQTLKKDFFEGMARDFGQQMFGLPVKDRHGELQRGENLEMKDVLTGKREAEEKLKKQIAFERQLRSELEVLENRKVNELKVQLQALIAEIQELAKATPELAEEVQVAALQAPAEPSKYHIIFFEKLLEFIKSFRKKISSAAEWLYAVNKRAAKKGNVWGARYKKHGAKFLLSGEHYLTRSAG